MSIGWGRASHARRMLAASLLAMAVAVEAPPAEAKPPKPGKCTISGTKARDTLRGTKRSDVICGLGGRDRLVAGKGRDVLIGAGGNDLLKARDGDDLLLGSAGDDDLFGEDGDDKLVGGRGADLLDGGEGDNACRQTDDGDLVVTTCWMGYRLDELTLSPPSVDTSGAPASVSVSLEITDTRDAPGELSSVALDIHRPGAQITQLPGENELRLTEGTVTRGTWTGEVTLPQYSMPGSHSISLVLRERMAGEPPESDGNRSSWRWPVPPSDLRAAGLPHAIEQTGFGDEGAPRVLSLEATPRMVDTSSGPVDVEVRARVVDDLLGTEAVDLYMYEPRPDYFGATDMRLVSGTPMDGVWKGVYTMPRYSLYGYHGIGIGAQDRLHRRGYNPQELTQAGLDPVIGQVGEGDTTAPTLKSLSFDPESGGAWVTLGATDAQTGVHSADFRFAPTWPLLTVNLSDPVSGTANDGVWRAFLGNASPGTYTLQHLTLSDDMAHNRHYTTADLQAAGFPTQVTIP